MKEIKLYIGIIAVLLTAMLTGCSDSIADNEPSKDETEEGYYTPVSMYPSPTSNNR